MSSRVNCNYSAMKPIPLYINDLIKLSGSNVFHILHMLRSMEEPGDEVHIASPRPPILIHCHMKPAHTNGLPTYNQPSILHWSW